MGGGVKAVRRSRERGAKSGCHRGEKRVDTSQSAQRAEEEWGRNSEGHAMGVCRPGTREIARWEFLKDEGGSTRHRLHLPSGKKQSPK